jgi:hypothetical protein
MAIHEAGEVVAQRFDAPGLIVGETGEERAATRSKKRPGQYMAYTPKGGLRAVDLVGGAAR